VGSLLSAISGQFAKAIALGTMFPVIIVSMLNVLLVAPLLPQTAAFRDLLRRIAVGEEKWGAVALTFVVLVVTGLLYNLNIPIIRLYEGYSWENSAVGSALASLKKRRLGRLRRLHSSVSSLRGRMVAIAPNNALVDGLVVEQSALAVALNSQLPDGENWVLPTRLGNVIRCFERYSTLAYGMDAIVLWPRLVAKIDSGFASTIDDAKTSFDFMLNTSFLCALSACGVFAILLLHPTPLLWGLLVPYLLPLALFVALAFLFYAFAVNRAFAWGQGVRAAFDLYRLSLLKDLGYEQKPLTYQEERAMWLDISSQMLYADSRNDPLSLEQKTTRIVASPSDIQVESWREIGEQEPNLRIPVLVRLTNKDANNKVTLLRLIDAIPDGFKYVPGSVAVDPEVGFFLRRFAPFEVVLGPIPENGTIVVTYSIKP